MPFLALKKLWSTPNVAFNENNSFIIASSSQQQILNQKRMFDIEFSSPFERTIPMKEEENRSKNLDLGARRSYTFLDISERRV